MKEPLSRSRSVQFARTLALATTLALPACGSSDPSPNTNEPGSQGAADPTAPAPTTTSPATPSPAPTTALATAPREDVHDAGADAPVDAGRLSGPLPPPELPASMV